MCHRLVLLLLAACSVQVLGQAPFPPPPPPPPPPPVDYNRRVSPSPVNDAQPAPASSPRPRSSPVVIDSPDTPSLSPAPRSSPRPSPAPEPSPERSPVPSPSIARSPARSPAPSPELPDPSPLPSPAASPRPRPASPVEADPSPAASPAPVRSPPATRSPALSPPAARSPALSPTREPPAPVPTEPPSIPPAGCGIDAEPGILIAGGGLVWNQWKAVKGAQNDFWDQSSIRDDVQGQIVASAADCNCVCASVAKCAAYTFLGGDIKQCWLHNALLNSAFFDSAYLSNVTENEAGEKFAVPIDTVLARVIKKAGSWPSCGDNIPVLPGVAVVGTNTDYLSNVNLTQPFVATVSECNTACGNEFGCSFFYMSTDANTGETLCQLVSDALGLGEASTAEEAVDVYPLTSCASCGIDAQKSFLFQGQVLKNWSAVPGAVETTWGMWNQSGIPDDVQGVNAPNPEECNCRCASVPNCVGYTWLGGDLRECWLHNDVLNFAFLSGNETDVDFLDANNTRVAVPDDTTIGRVIRSQTWPLCSGVSFYRAELLDADRALLDNPDLEPFRATPAQCNQACGDDRGCTVFAMTEYDTTAGVGLCQLFSYSSSFENSRNTSAPLVSTLKACGSSTPAVVDDNCGIDKNPRIMVEGQVWFNWTRQANTSYDDSDEPSTWDMRYIPSDIQGLPADSPSVCNCRCAGIPTCIAWTLLGGDYQQCWLYSLVAFGGKTYDTFNDVVNGSSVTTQVPADTVSGRVTRNTDIITQCTSRTSYDYPITTVASDDIKGAITGNWTNAECNRRCLNDPACVAFAGFDDGKTAETVKCTLYSTAEGGLDTTGLTVTLSQYPENYNYWAPVTVCSESIASFVDVATLRASVPPPPPPPAPAAAIVVGPSDGANGGALSSQQRSDAAAGQSSSNGDGNSNRNAKIIGPTVAIGGAALIASVAGAAYYLSQRKAWNVKDLPASV